MKMHIGVGSLSREKAHHFEGVNSRKTPDPPKLRDGSHCDSQASRGRRTQRFASACALLLAFVFCAPLAAQESEAPLKDPPFLKNKKSPDKKPQQLSTRELIAKRVDDSHLNQLHDGRPLVSEENETLTMLMYRMPEYEPAIWDTWCQKPLDVSAVVASPKEFHIQGMLIKGRARQVEITELLPEIVPLYDNFSKYYRVTIAVEGSPHPIVVCSRRIPKAWQEAKELDEVVRVQAIFLKAGETADDKTPLYFSAARIGWLPDEENEAFGVSADLVWLAQQGMDISLWDDVTNGNSEIEGECFYQLFATLKNAKASARRELKARPFDLAGLLQSPDELCGRTYDVTATAQRVQKVSVSDSIRQRFGIDHFYQIDLLIPLDKQVIKLSSPKGKQGPVYARGFPTTLDVLKLPEGLEEGERISEQVRLKGVFFKLWAFQSDFTKEHGQRQPSPLFLGVEPSVIPREPAEGAYWGPTVMMCTIIAGVGIVWFTAWRFSRGDKQFDRRVLRKFAAGDRSATGFKMPVREEPNTNKPSDEKPESPA